MPCSHLQEFYDVARKHDLKIATSDVVHIICPQCDEQDRCPTALTDGEEVIVLEQKSVRISRDEVTQ